ncbi:AAA-ATPase-like protein [Cinnamomum micranthum f. kanehirae]|uniref:AAA-ATPase-like protein n=1 Tax=Cinnamomum micranthum f. kanehirae TaxID=337451 RepID=A0A3S4PA57_9MAGN|nr:AAA-ATPase-like protein [Cinnamomum micranthum f. kanehirae]
MIMIASYPLYFLAAIAFGFAILKIAKILLLMRIRFWRSFEDRLHFYQFYKIPEFNDCLHENPLYRQVSVYLSSLISLEDSDFTNIFSGRKPNEFSLQLDSDRSIVHDSFLDANISWKSDLTRCRMFVLKIRKEDKRRILRLYLQHIQTVADEIDQKRRDVRLFSNVRTDDFGIGRWRSVPFTHPSTIETIAMDSDLKHKIRSDLDLFLKSKQYYHRLGRVWKRSYLLYGPAGTGKTSFVAAMARFLCYDVYDVDLSRIGNDSELKSLLLQTSGKSVILIEDLDRFLAEKSEKVSLAGVLSFMDGIFSCCAEERVMVFTMNSKQNIDPAIFRPGRLDVHIYFPLCDFSAFKSLAGSYLGVKDHRLFPHVEEVFRGGATLSPAEIGEILIANRSSPSRALKSVISALQSNGGGSVSVRIERMISESGSGNGRSDLSEKSDGVLVRRDSCVHNGRVLRRWYGMLRMK